MAPHASPLGRSFVNGISLLGANVVTSGAQYLIVVLAARALGPETFGTYLFAFTFASFFATICNFGLDRVLIRELVHRPAGTSTNLLAAAALRLLLGLLSLALALVAAWWLGYRPELRLVIALLLVSQILGLFSELVRSVLFAGGAMPREAKLRATGRLVAVVAVAGSLFMGWKIVGLAGALGIGAFLELLLYAAAVARRGALHRVQVEWDVAKDLARSAWPIAVHTALVVLYFRINIVMLTSWAGPGAAGLFGVAFTFLQVLQVVSGSAAGVILPTLTARKMEGSDSVRSAVRTTTFYTLLFVLPTTVGMSLMAGDLVGVVYGSQYSGAVPALAVLVWANPFMFLGSLYGTLLIVLNAERSLIPLSAAALVVSGVANYLLVPSLGPVGAAWASVVTEGAVAAAAFWAVRSRLGRIGGGAVMLRPVMVAGAVAAALLGLRAASAPWRALAGVLAFAAGAVAVDGVTADRARVRLVMWRRGGIDAIVGRRR